MRERIRKRRMRERMQRRKKSRTKEKNNVGTTIQLFELERDFEFKV